MLKHKVKLFRNKDDSSYISGRPGDIMVLPMMIGMRHI